MAIEKEEITFIQNQFKKVVGMGTGPPHLTAPTSEQRYFSKGKKGKLCLFQAKVKFIFLKQTFNYRIILDL